MPHFNRSFAFATLATLALASSVLADAPTPATLPAPLSAADESAFLKPYLNDDTFLILHADVALLDTTALEAFLTDAIKSAAPVEEAGPAADKLHTARIMADLFLARFKKLGGRQIYAVVTQTGNRPPREPLILIPVEPTGDIKTLAVLLTSLPNTTSTQINDHLLALTPVPPNRNANPADANDPNAAALADKVQAIVPSPRPDYDKALSAGSGAFQLVIAPGQTSRAQGADHMPTLPSELGGGSSDILFKNFQFLTTSLTLPPNPKLAYFIQFDSPENAKLSVDIINKWSDLMNRTLSRNGKKIDIAPYFVPVVTDSAITVELDADKIKSVAALFIPPMFQARRQGQSIIVMSAIRQDVLACTTYAESNDGNWPPDLHTLVDKGLLQNDKSLTNPNDPQHRAYIYHPWTADELKKLDAGRTPVIWEASDDTSTAPIAVGFVDGHGELVKKEAFAVFLNDAKEKAKAPAMP